VTSGNERYVLHHSVCARWWLWHLDTQREAFRFLERSLLSGALAVLAAEDLMWRTLAAISDDVGAIRLAGAIAEPLFDDVASLFRRLVEVSAIRLRDREVLAREAFTVSAYRGLGLDDASVAVLADQTGLPLLVADRSLAAMYQAMAEDRTTFRVLTLSDQAAGH
jgi:predicted nucleic acid-binding protein